MARVGRVRLAWVIQRQSVTAEWAAGPRRPAAAMPRRVHAGSDSAAVHGRSAANGCPSWRLPGPRTCPYRADRAELGSAHVTR
jgi:hypothetical protein